MLLLRLRLRLVLWLLWLVLVLVLVLLVLLLVLVLLVLVLLVLVLVLVLVLTSPLRSPCCRHRGFRLSRFRASLRSRLHSHASRVRRCFSGSRRDGFQATDVLARRFVIGRRRDREWRVI